MESGHAGSLLFLEPASLTGARIKSRESVIQQMLIRACYGGMWTHGEISLLLWGKACMCVVAASKWFE